MRLAARLHVAATVVLAASLAHAASNGRRPITETDIYRFVWLADPQISPDGRQVAFVRVTVNEKKDGYDTAIWTVPADASAPPRAFTSGGRDSAPRWSPDGSRLAFLRATERDGKPQPAQVHVIPVGGGEARSLTDLPKGAGTPAWSPDGQRLAFTSTTTSEDVQKQERERKDGRKPDERESDVRVITRAVYRFNNTGYLDPKRPPHIWVLDVPGSADEPSAPRQVTTGSFGEQSPAFSGDGRRIYFTSHRAKEPYYEPDDQDLYSVSVDGGEPERALSIDGPIGSYALDRQGRRVVFTGSVNANPPRSFDQDDLFVAEGAGAAPRNLTGAYDFDVAGGIAADQHAPRGGQPTAPVWSRDGRAVYVRVAEQGRANLKRVDLATGKVDAITTGDQEVVGYTGSADGARLALSISTATEINDLYALDSATGKTTRLTHVNQPLMDELDLPAPEEISYASFDGRKIHGWIQKPPGFDPAKKYPFILQVHGGPHAAYGHAFYHEFHWMAAKGYVVLYTNPRGSSSYGQEFGNLIQYAYPGDDHKDLMAGVDEVLRRGYVDPTKLGITGGSGGGVLTNWAITQTDRFAAAVSQRSIADWADFWYTADFSLFQPSWFKGAPWEDPQDFARRSAITHVAKVKTPLMLIEGEEDWRTPAAAGGEQMFRALKYLKKPVVMVRFPEESHDLSRTGTPWRRVERLQHIVNWFDVHLQGKKLDIYDMP
jgi:dipeptidyl aminopeptidase/acylaminoacyl peptidase